MSLETAANEDFAYVRRLVLGYSGIRLEEDKAYLLESRLTPLAYREGFASLEALLAHLRSSDRTPVHVKACEAMITKETSFFRDAGAFEALAGVVLPEIAAREREGTVNVLSAACSSGQELYSVAMLMRERFPSLSRRRVRLVGVDLSGESVERAREGRYSPMETARGLDDRRLDAHFTRDGDAWRVREELRAWPEFVKANLLDPWPPLPLMDIVLLRNFLIYLEPSQRAPVLDRARAALRPGGVLFLGNAERLEHGSESFERLTHGVSVHYRLKEG